MKLRVSAILFLLVSSGILALVSSPGVRADTQDYFPGTETAVKGTVGGAAFPGAIQTSDNSYRTPQEADQAAAPSDLTPDTETLTTGTKVSGTFNADVLSDNGASITYREANTGGGGSGAAPAFRAFGSIAASTGADISVQVPACSAGDIALVQAWVRDQDDTVLTPSGYSAISGTPFDRNTASRYWLFWKRLTASESPVLIDKSTSTGDTYGIMVCYSGALASGDPWEVVGSASTGTTDPSSITGITTLTANSLVVVPVGGEDNNNANIVTTGTDPAAYDEHYAESIAGADGAVTVSEGARTAAGATGTISVDWNTAVPVGWGGMALALKPEPAANYQIEIRYDWTTETCADTRRLTVNAWHTNTEDILLQVWDFGTSAWNTRATITATADGTTYTWDLGGTNEWNSGSPRVRYLGSSESGDTTQTDLLVDYATVKCVHPADYEVETKYDWTGVDTTGDSWTLVVECKRVTNPEDGLIQVVDSTETTWTTRYTCNADTDTTYNTYALTTDELDAGTPNMRVIGATESGDASQSTWDLDLIKIVRQFTVSNSPPTLTLNYANPYTITRDQSVDFGTTYTDVDNDAPTYVKITMSPAGTNRTLDQNNTGDTVYSDGKTYHLTDPANTYCPGVQTFLFSTSDGQAHNIRSADQTLTISNTVPSITNGGGAPTTVIHGNAYSYDFDAADVDVPVCQSFTWSKVSGPAWLTMASGTGVLSGTAPDDLSGGGSVTVRVSDGTATNDYGPFTVTVTNANPAFTSGEQSSETANPGVYTHDYNAADADPLDAIYFTMVTNNGELSIGPTNGTVYGTLVTLGMYYVNVTVHDQAIPNGTAWNNYTLTVDPPTEGGSGSYNPGNVSFRYELLTPLSGCTFRFVFTGSSPYPVNRVTWEFPDGTFVFGETVEHTFVAGCSWFHGTWAVKMTFIDDAYAIRSVTQEVLLERRPLVLGVFAVFAFAVIPVRVRQTRRKRKSEKDVIR